MGPPLPSPCMDFTTDPQNYWSSCTSTKSKLETITSKWLTLWQALMSGQYIVFNRKKSPSFHENILENCLIFDQQGYSSLEHSFNGA
jgi:hypothetical protein